MATEDPAAVLEVAPPVLACGVLNVLADDLLQLGLELLRRGLAPVRDEIGLPPVLQRAPDPLYRIQRRGVRRQEQGVDLDVVEAVLDHVAVVSSVIVHDHYCIMDPSPLTIHLQEEVLCRLLVRGVSQHVDHVGSLVRDGADDRYATAPVLTLRNLDCLVTWHPHAPAVLPEVHAGLVHEDHLLIAREQSQQPLHKVLLLEEQLLLSEAREMNIR